MAVVITSKFYQESEWKDISKVVFTSPNMDSPSVAGTRSHILPGEGDLGTWYEDTSEMFKIESSQTETSNDFYNFTMRSKEEVDLSSSPTYIDVEGTNYDGLHTYVKENSGVEVIGYEDETSLMIDSQTKLEYTPLEHNLDEITDESDTMLEEVTNIVYESCRINWYNYDNHRIYTKEYIRRDPGWYTEVITDLTECYIRFEFSEAIKLAAVSISSIDVSQLVDQYDFTPGGECSGDYTTTTISSDKYFVGNWKVEASSDKETWTTLYTGSNTTNLTKFAYLTNSSYWLYYRLVFSDNASLDDGTFNTDYYGIGKLRFHTHEYSEDDGTDSVALHSFKDNDDVKLIKVSNAEAVEGAEEVQATETTTDITGTGLMSTISGISYYSIDMNDVSDTLDYMTSADCESATASGLGIDILATTYTKEDKIYAEGVAYTTVSAITGSPGFNYMNFSCYAEIPDIVVDTVDWTGTAVIGYTTVASGTNTVSGSATYTLGGTTTRTYTATVRAKRESYRLYIDEIVTPSGIIEDDEELHMWGYDNATRPLDMDSTNSIVFEVTTGEAYDCRLTAWDDATHSTLANELIQGDHARVSAVAFCCAGSSVLAPEVTPDPVNLVYPPVHNRILKGNTVYLGEKLYYGDFDMVYRPQTDVHGDFLMFKPQLYGIHSGISYGVHDFLVTLHYSYT